MGEAPVYIVTGAAGNLGRSAVAALAGRGARVLGADRSARDPSPEAAHWASGVDFFDPGACASLVSEALSRFGRLDGVAHTVGGFAIAPAAEGDADLWTGMFRLNVLTTLNVFRAALPPMRAAGRGALVAVGAAPALTAPARFGAYAGSKAAVLRLVEAYAAELKPEGVRVNAVLPATMDTPQNRAAMPKADPSRWATPDEVAQVIAFLLGDGASAVTGAAIQAPGRA